jgi:hypothetical protein
MMASEATTLSLEINGRRHEFELLTALAPDTIELLSSGLVADGGSRSVTAYHGITTGMAVTIPIGEPTDVCENRYVFGCPAGSLLYFPNLNRRVIDGRVSSAELIVTYGIVRFFDWTGWQPHSLIGSLINGSVAELSDLGREVRANGGTDGTVAIS